jgi:hypothetical protein
MFPIKSGGVLCFRHPLICFVCWWLMVDTFFLRSVHGPVCTIRGPRTVQRFYGLDRPDRRPYGLDRSWTVNRGFRTDLDRDWTVPGSYLDRTTWCLDRGWTVSRALDR